MHLLDAGLLPCLLYFSERLLIMLNAALLNGKTEVGHLAIVTLWRDQTI